MRNTVMVALFCTLLLACDITSIPTTSDTITEAEAAEGLKSALNKGISEGTDQVSQLDGYFGNPQIKIPFPPDAIKVANTLRDIGLGSEVDRVILSINRAAEDAATKAKPIFLSAIKQLTIRAAFDILFGGKDAATQYLRNTTSSALTAEFKPIIKTSLDRVNATKYWEDIITRYNQVPFITKINPDLVDYVNGKALDGLFYVVAEEEARIRENPLERTTQILIKVFGYYDRKKNLH